MENNEKKEVVFTEGIKQIRKINDEFFYMKINSKEFYEWMEKHKKDNGCVYINLCVSHYGNWYSKLSTYKGKELVKAQDEYKMNKAKADKKEDNEKIPF